MPKCHMHQLQWRLNNNNIINLEKLWSILFAIEQNQNETMSLFIILHWEEKNIFFNIITKMFGIQLHERLRINYRILFLLLYIIL